VDGAGRKFACGWHVACHFHLGRLMRRRLPLPRSFMGVGTQVAAFSAPRQAAVPGVSCS